MEWCRTYCRERIGSLVDKRRGGNRAKLTKKQIKELCMRLCTHTPANLFGTTAATTDGKPTTPATERKAPPTTRNRQARQASAAAATTSLLEYAPPTPSGSSYWFFTTNGRKFSSRWEATTRFPSEGMIKPLYAMVASPAELSAIDT